jgi:phosphatidylglycerophosphate synthase
MRFTAPWLLVVGRALAGPVILLAAGAGVPGPVLVAILVAAILSDILDGVIARRRGVATESLRRADSIADTIFYLSALGALVVRAPPLLQEHALGIGAVLVLELARLAVELRKFGRQAAYHMWSAKLWGVTLFLGFSEALLRGAAGPLFQLAIVVGIVTDLEGLAASIILRRWRHDVPSIWHAVLLARSPAV